MNKFKESVLVEAVQTACNNAHTATHYLPPLDIDGKWGPDTEERVAAYMLRDLIWNERYELTPLRCCVGMMYNDIGLGGDPGTNNVSDYLGDLRESTGFDPEEDGAWCAIQASGCLMVHFPTLELSRGAKDLSNNFMRDVAGATSVKPGELHDGECFLGTWDRGKPGVKKDAWKGHVRLGIHLRGVYYMIGGNEDPGDRVRASFMPVAEVEKRLHRLVVVR